MEQSRALKQNIPNIIRDMEKRAKGGDLHALAQLGVYYLLGHQVNRDVTHGFETIRKAAENGEIASQTLLATLYAAGMGTTENWEEAYDWLVVAAQNGDPKAVGQVTYFLPQLSDPAIRMTWQEVRNHLGQEDEGDVASVVTHHQQPHIRTQENFLDARTCAYVIQQAAPRLQRAYVNDGQGGAVLDTSRTNSAMSFFPLDNDLVIQRINKKISTFMEMPLAYGEPLSALHYSPGQAYLDHYDFFNPEYPAHIPHLKSGGQRVKTFLIYLNDGFRGGETYFPKLDWKYKGKKGEAVVFDNVLRNGDLINQSLHAGLPTKTGEKWLLSKWLKDKAQY